MCKIGLLWQKKHIVGHKILLKCVNHVPGQSVNYVTLYKDDRPYIEPIVYNENEARATTSRPYRNAKQLIVNTFAVAIFGFSVACPGMAHRY